jgi:hypothetical protein
VKLSTLRITWIFNFALMPLRLLFLQNRDSYTRHIQNIKKLDANATQRRKAALRHRQEKQAVVLVNQVGRNRQYVH